MAAQGKNLKPFPLYICAGFAISALSFALDSKTHAIFHRASDAFFVSFVAIGGLGGLLFVSNHGLFDLIGFSMRKVFNTHWGSKRLREENRKNTYAEYTKNRGQRRQNAGAPLAAGGVFLILSLAMLALFYARG